MELKILNASSTKKIEFSANWNGLTMNEQKKESLLMNYRIAYLSEGVVNWCPELGTVLANDEVKRRLFRKRRIPCRTKENETMEYKNIRICRTTTKRFRKGRFFKIT